MPVGTSSNKRNGGIVPISSRRAPESPPLTALKKRIHHFLAFRRPCSYVRWPSVLDTASLPNIFLQPRTSPSFLTQSTSSKHLVRRTYIDSAKLPLHGRSQSRTGPSRRARRARQAWATVPVQRRLLPPDSFRVRHAVQRRRLTKRTSPPQPR